MPPQVDFATAGDWLVALQESPNDRALHRQFEDWIAADPNRQEEWEAAVRVYDLIGLSVPAYHAKWAATEPASARKFSKLPETRSGNRSDGKRRRLTFGAAIGAAVAAGVALLFVTDIETRIRADHFADTGRIGNASLADGSSVTLAPETGISVSMTPRDREIELLSGKALFSVASDSTRPFRVRAGDAVVTVLGTEFEVAREGDDVEVSVRHGSVNVRDTADERPFPRLTAGDSIQLKGAGESLSSNIRRDQIAAWAKGQLLVKNGTVDEVVDALRPWFEGAILLKGSALARQPITGVYDLKDPEKALRAVAMVQGAKVYRITPWLLVISVS
ncbi:FecR family protein [Hwanghaeella sp.]|uniref:FecR family protein n=1 Tax=Hwanghaeella sp. TaxID=2605943 RepID=UPI003CCB935A